MVVSHLTWGKMRQSALLKLPLPIRCRSPLWNNDMPDNIRPKRTCPTGVGVRLNTPTLMRTGHHFRDIWSMTIPSPIHLDHGPAEPLSTNTQTGEMNSPVDVTERISTILGVTTTGDTTTISMLISKIPESPLVVPKVLSNLSLTVLFYLNNVTFYVYPELGLGHTTYQI